MLSWMRAVKGILLVYVNAESRWNVARPQGVSSGASSLSSTPDNLRLRDSVIRNHSLYAAKSGVSP